MASTIVSRTQSGAESAAGRRTWTFSCWFKKCKIIGGGSNQEIFGSDSNGARSNNYNLIDVNSNDCLDVNGYESGATFRKITNRKFRDCNAWYHLVVAFDSTQSTADDRIKIYINGVRETSFSTSTNPAQNHQSKFFASNKVHAFGRSSQTFDGIISHVHATEGTAYAPTVFGSTDATTGEWKINADPTVSYGTNGFFLFKNDNSVTNQAGNSSGNFAVTAGTLTKTEDNPSNNFCTLNPLLNRITGYASGNATSLDFQNGNTFGGKVTHGAYFGTMAVSTGKWYWEVKVQDTNQLIGIAPMRPNGGVTYFYDDTTVQGYYPYGNNVYTNGVSASGGPYDNTSNKIYSFALDATNNKLWVGRDGTFTGDPVAGSGATWASLPTENTDKEEIFWTPLAHSMSTSQNNNCYFNFGNGYFGTTAVSSAGTNASNNGIFEYNVPTGYTALCTKGLNV